MLIEWICEKIFVFFGSRQFKTHFLEFGSGFFDSNEFGDTTAPVRKM